ncbi:MAG TPA: UbiA family prenyltransferase [Gemmatimonadales bacterium]|nr:UbiA family prenyltransferase [Gemmatimonadales bacterium]
MSVPGWARAGARAAGYRVLGPRLAYLLHTRPAEWPIMTAHTALGYVVAVGVGGASRGERLEAALLGVAAWVVGLNGGTLAINSAFDRDEGDIAYLRAPPPPPRHLFRFGLGLMAAGFGAALALTPAYTAAYALCLVLSLLYSVPPARLKAVPGADWLINMWGFGTLTPFAGWAATGVPLTRAGGLVLLAFCPLFAALYPLTQLYQMEEDRRRGDRTLALRLGTRASLTAAALCATVSFTLLAAAGAAAGWRTGGRDLLRWAALLLAAVVWAAVLGPWLAGPARWTPARHQRGMYLALAAWAVTDLVVALAWGTEA